MASMGIRECGLLLYSLDHEKSSIGVGTVGAVGAAAPTNNWKGGHCPHKIAKAMISIKKQLTLYIPHKPDSDLIIYN